MSHSTVLNVAQKLLCLKKVWRGSKSAFFVNRFKSTFTTLQHAHGKVEVKCEACSGDRAESFCRQCAMFICQTCADSHLGQKSHYANHEVVSLQDLKEGKAKAPATKLEPSLQKCPDHNEDMKIFCYDCNIIICRDCTVVDHKDHRFQFCKTAAPAVIEDLKKELETLNPIGDRMLRALEEIRTTKEEVEVQGVGVAQTINASFDEIIKIVEFRRKQVLEEGEKRVHDKVDELAAQEKTLSLASAEVQSVVDFTERCVNHLSDSEIMSVHINTKEQIVQKREQFSEQSRSITPVVDADLGVSISCADDIKDVCQTKAKFFQIPVDLSKCSVEDDVFVNAAYGELSCVALTTVLANGRRAKCSVTVSSELKCIHDDSVVQCVVDQSGPGQYLIQYTPTVRGRHALTVSVDGCHVAGSPFPIFVNIHPSQLGPPVKVWNNLVKPSGLAIASNGMLIAAQQGGDVLVNIDSHGICNRINRKTLKLDSYFVTGVEVDENSFLYLVLSNCASIYKLAPDNRITTSTQAKYCDGHLGMALVNDEVMVCPRPAFGTIVIYTRELNLLREIKRVTMGQFRDISSDSCGNLYVSDYRSKCVHAISRDGELLRSFGSGDNQVEALTFPLGVCVSGRFVYVCNNGHTSTNHSICVFTTEGKLLSLVKKEQKILGSMCLILFVWTKMDFFMYLITTITECTSFSKLLFKYIF